MARSIKNEIIQGVRKKVKVVFIVFVSIIVSEVSVAQNIVVLADSTEIKENPDPSSRTLLLVNMGTLLQTQGPTVNNWILVEHGYVHQSQVMFLKSKPVINTNLIQETRIKDEYSEILQSKNPADLTQTEVLYLMYGEQKKNERLRNDISTIKNIQLTLGIVAIVSLLVSTISLTSK